MTLFKFFEPCLRHCLKKTILDYSLPMLLGYYNNVILITLPSYYNNYNNNNFSSLRYVFTKKPFTSAIFISENNYYHRTKITRFFHNVIFFAWRRSLNYYVLLKWRELANVSLRQSKTLAFCEY